MSPFNEAMTLKNDMAIDDAQDDSAQAAETLACDNENQGNASVISADDSVQYESIRQVGSVATSSIEESNDMSDIPVTPQRHLRDFIKREVAESTQSPLRGPSVSLIDQEDLLGDGVYCMEVVAPEEIPSGTACVNTKEELQVGDHVYQWRSWMGIPGIFQHHGIVMDIHYGTLDSESDEVADPPKESKVIAKLTIADFSNVDIRAAGTKIPDPVEQQRRRLSGLTQEGILRTYTDTDQWHKVEYQAPWWKRSVYRSGTCTSVASDAVGLVLARVNYIVRHPDVLPDYHVVNANCECVAVWCKTGTWSTLQASSFLELTAAGQVKSSATLAATAASAQVTVQAPAAGLWGWLGYTTTTQVSWLSLHPVVIPALAGYAVLSVGIPAVMYVNARKQWKLTTDRLKQSFWEDAMNNPDVFAECITHWSSK